MTEMHNNQKPSPPAVPAKAELNAGPRGLQLTSFEGMYRFAQLLEKSGFAPKGMTAPAIVAAIQYGAEVGLAPMQSLTKIAVINGRPAIFGDALLALCQKHPLWEGHIETSGHSDQFGYWAKCEVRRRGNDPHIAVFTEAMAKQAGLWGKTGPWTQYPQRMLQMRARSWALRNSFPDAIGGLIPVEEAEDSPPPQWRTEEVHDRHALPAIQDVMPQDVGGFDGEGPQQVETTSPNPDEHSGGGQPLERKEKSEVTRLPTSKSPITAQEPEDRRRKWAKIAQMSRVSPDQEDPPDNAQGVLFEEK